MKRIGPTLLAFAALFLAPDTKDAPIGIQQVEAQSACTYIAYGAVLTAAQWQSCFQQKADVGLNGAFAPTPATANIVLYVATTGSDSNPCSGGSKCLTIQHAAIVGSQYNYENTYTLTINVADGTYAVNGTAPAVTLPFLTNYPLGLNPTLNGDTVTPANAVISNTSGDAVATANLAAWNIQGFRLKSTSGTNDDLDVNDSSQVAFTGAMDFAGSGTLISAVNHSGIFAFSQNINISTTSAVYAFYGYYKSSIIFDGSTITFPGGGSSYSQYLLYLTDHSIFGTATFVNAGVTTGNKFALLTASICEYSGSRASFPGNAATAFGGFSSYWGDAGIVLADLGGAIHGDYNITTGGQWQFDAQTTVFTSNSANGTVFDFANTSVGGKQWLGISLGSGAAPGWFAMYDLTDLEGPLALNQKIVAVPSDTALYWDSTTNAASGAPDTGLSRGAAGVLDVGNGTVGDFSATIKSAHVTATALANAATTSAVCYNTGTGVLTYDGTIGTCTTSDERLKNIGTRIDDALNKLLKINGFYFTWKNPKQYGVGRQIGVGAQTVEKVFPEAVATGSDGLKSVGYDKLVAPIIEALRELKADNDNMQHEIVALQRRAVRR